MRGKSYLYYDNYLTFDSSIWIRKVIFGKIWIKSWYAYWNQNDKQWRLPSWIFLFCRHIEPRYKFISRHRFAFLFIFYFFIFFPFYFRFYFCSISIANFHSNSLTENNSRFAYGSFRLLSARLRLQSICLRLTCQFAYVLNLKSFILILSFSARFNKDFSTIQF